MTPLVLVAGYLGAGKTTFLRQVLTALGARGLRPRVILNDYENARVDAATLRDVTTALVPISGSCLCCGTQDELVAALGSDGPPHDAVLVECNGTTDTGQLVELLTEAAGLDALSYPWQVTLVDAERFGQRGWQNAIERDQIASSTHLRLSRTDLAPPDRVAAVEAAAAALAPRAAWTTAAALAADIAALAGTLRALPGRRALDPALLAAAPSGARPAEEHGRHHFASFQLPLPRPVDPRAFQRFLEELPGEILRAKGIVTLTDPPGAKRAFQKVEGRVEISPCALADEDELEPVAVFVGVGAPLLAVRARLERLWRDRGG